MILRFPTRWMLVLGVVFICVPFLVASYPSLGLENIPSTPENIQIMDTIQKMYEVFSKVRESEDIELLSTVLIDHPIYESKLSADEVKELKEYANQILGTKAQTQFGYLSAMRVKMLHRIQGTKLLKSAQAQLGHELTPQELQELAKQNHGRIPTIPNPNLPSVRQIKAESYTYIKIEGDNATAVYDDGVKNQTALLVKVDGKWYVAGIF